MRSPTYILRRIRTWVFEHGGSVRVEAIVQGLGATAAPSQGETAHEHHQ
jgi:hypothetical protein